MKNKKLTGAKLIAIERKRQIEEENWDKNHDQESAGSCQLAAAAGCYLANYVNKHFGNNNAGFRIYVPHAPINASAAEIYGYNIKHVGMKGWVDAWPWDDHWDKRDKHDKVRSLVIAGALIAAELDRINGLWNKNEEQDALKD